MHLDHNFTDNQSVCNWKTNGAFELQSFIDQLILIDHCRDDFEVQGLVCPTK